LEQTLAQLTRVAERTRVLAYERGEIERGLVDLAAELEALGAQRTDAERRRAEREESVRASQAEREAFESVLREAREAVTQAKMEAATLAERLGSVERAREANVRSREQVGGRMRFLEGAIGETLEQIRSRQEDAAATEGEVAKNLEARDHAERAKVEAFNSLEDMRRALSEREHGVRRLRAELHEAEGRVTELLLECRNLENALTRLIEQVEERYLERLPDLVEAGTLAEREEADEALAERVAELRQKIETMGEVNLTAIEEYEELSQRHAFLSEQKADLEEAMAELRQTIAKINATTRKLFEDTFHAIDERFQQVMPRLFAGGKGHLTLTEPENLLETGVEIHIQPPGKRLQTMTLLSGGEKALAAVSLLIAIFLTKPSPFCLFDEVDAPLDEANVGRFSDLIHEMSELSQFLLITHNKRTMQTADHLYGVTMQEPGVSKIVSVELEAYAGA
ncbi:MAG: AAA family ATPase, partial [Candidatus Methylomirabilis sp.]|nr:AAA family ATPase [Deltaproteobacteria bacterium]